MSTILGISGSLRADSRSRRVLRATLRLAAEDFGANTELVDLRETPLPLYQPDGEAEPPNRTAIRERLLRADAVVLAGPDYHGSIAGALKNFMDHFWEEFAGRLFGTIVSSHEKGLTVQDQMRTVIRQCYGWSLPYGIGFNPESDLTGAGGQPGERLMERCRMMARDLTVYGRMLREQFEADLAEDPPPVSFARKFAPKK